jgi:hypothetical protein
MWVMVMVSLALFDSPKLTVVPGAEFATEADCVQASHVRLNFDSEKGGGGAQFSICVPKDSVQIGKLPENSDPQKQ